MRSVRAVIGTRETVTIGPLASVLEAAQLMAAHRIGAVPVVDGDRLAGILSLRDLMAVDLDEKDEAITLLNAYVHYIPADIQAKAHT